VIYFKANTQILQYLNQPGIRGIKVYYPFLSDTKDFYEDCKRPKGGCGYLFSIKFDVKSDAITFYDALKIAKGPMLETNFTLACAHERIRMCHRT
jgi:cystathionine beta-lyase/cystathionine gamma-synthase